MLCLKIHRERKKRVMEIGQREARFGLKIDGFQVTGCEEVVK